MYRLDRRNRPIEEGQVCSLVYNGIKPIAFVLCERRTRLSKYDALTEFLNRQLADRVRLLFDDIEDEDKIGLQLPKAAREHPAWWANEVDPKTRHYQCRAWTTAGWRVEHVDCNREIVEFERVRTRIGPEHGLISLEEYEQRIREERQKQPPDSSPVFCLSPEIFESPVRIAPEKFGEIRKLVRPVHFHHKSPEFDISTSGESIRVTAGALNLLWCASLAYFLAYQAFVFAQKNGQPVVRLGIDKETIAALDLYEWALKSVGAQRLEPWPEQLPQPAREPEYGSSLHVANEVFLMAVGWILLHEMGHIAHSHPFNAPPSESKDFEIEADHFATEHALGGITDQSVLLKRALGVAVANIVLVTTDISVRSSQFGSLTHPPSEERLSRNLRRELLPEGHPIHGFVAAMLQIHAAKYGVPFGLDEHAHFSSLVDDFCLAINRFRK
jgi:hypothetical protein